MNENIDIYYQNIRHDIISHIDFKVNTILDLGCGAGCTSKYLKDSKIVQRTYGIENNENAYRVAIQNLDYVIRGDMNNFSELLSRFPIQQFDCILAADILEHLINPWQVLSDLRKVMHNQTYLIISLPNIRYYPIIRNLVFHGTWEYQSEGIMDETHLRFFTKKSFIKKLIDLNFQIIKTSHSPFTSKIKIFNTLTFNLFSDFFVFQHIFFVKIRQ